MTLKPNILTPAEFLTEAVQNGYSRREIIRRATLLGFSLPVINALVASSASASGGATTRSGLRQTQQAAQPSGQVVVSLADEPLTLENWNSFSIYGHPILRNMMEALANRDPVTNDLVPELALSWERTDDLTWRFILRQGVTFHNDEEFNAEVAAFGLNYTWSPDNGFEILAILGPPLTATAVDAYTLDVASETPDPILPTRLYFSPIPSMRQIEENPESARDNPIGTGPYTFVEWVQGQHVRMTANPNWWGHTAEDAGGAVTIQDAEFQFRAESTVRAAQISTGEAQITHNLAPEDCESVPVCKPTASIETVILRLDTMHTAMQDPRVRQAIAQAVDVTTLAEQIYVGTVATQIYSPAALGYNESVEIYPYDLDAATALVAEAAGAGVQVDAPITLITTGSLPRSAEVVQYVAEQLNQIGLTASSQVLESAQYRPQVYGTGQDEVPADRGWIVEISHGNELMDASASISRYYACDPESDSTYCNPDVDAMIAEAGALEDEARDAAYQEISAVVHDAYAIIPIVHQNINYGMVDSVTWEPRMDGFMLIKEMSLQ